jgi:hypothetical protein
LKPKCDEQLSNLDFNFMLRRYMKAAPKEQRQPSAEPLPVGGGVNGLDGWTEGLVAGAYTRPLFSST